jgi:predicted esterase
MTTDARFEDSGTAGLDVADAAAYRHPSEHHLRVTRTARYVTLGHPHAALREVWIVCHGHGQLAARFIRHFAPIADPSRLIVAPEALSRFYLDPVASGPASERRVGATWMTREDRLSEVNDYVGYLDALHTHVFRQVNRSAVRLHVLGFSQGAATVCRWVCDGHASPDDVTLWAGVVPPDLDLVTDGAALRAARVSIVVGSRDEFATAEAVAQQEERLRAAGVAFRTTVFDGGHTLDADALRRLAEGIAAPLADAP